MQAIPIHRFVPADKPFAYDDLIDFINPVKPSKNHPHRHNYYEVFVFTKGGGTHMIDFVEYPIKSNSLHFISPGMVHSIKRNKACVGAVITFTKELFAMHQQQSILQQINLYHNNQFSPIIECNEEDLHFYKNLLNRIKVECQIDQLMGTEITQAYLTTLLIHANRNFVIRRQAALPQIFSDRRVQEFKNLLDMPFAEKPSVSSFANKMGVTAKQLNQILVKHTGMNPTEHINMQMLVEAKRLLVNTDRTIKEIAFQLYFDDPAYFGRFFKNQTDLTPNQFRSNMRKKYQN